MTTQEFSDLFDVLYNNITSNQAPGLDEYEKSVFLTKAEKQLVKEYFDRPLDRVQEGFDGSIKRQYDFSSLLKTKELYNIYHHWNNENTQDTFNLDGIPFLLPEDFFLPVNELIVDSKNLKYSVFGLTYDKYQRELTKPYPFPNKREAWRVITNLRGYNSGISTIEYIGADGTTEDIDISCSTAFASGGKDMWFTLQCNTSLPDKLNEYALATASGVLNTENSSILLGILDSTTDPIDSYLLMYRTVNDPKIEQLTCSFYSVTNSGGSTVDDSGNDKLWDDDTNLTYTFDGIGNDKKDCIYQDTSAIALTAVSVTGESSILGALKIYMRVCRDLQYNGDERIGKDPYSIIAIITFKHWEEGSYKNHKWVCWNGAYEYKNIGMIPIGDTSEKSVLYLRNDSASSLKFYFLEESGDVWNDVTLSPGVVHTYNNSTTVQSIKYIGVKDTTAGIEYPNIKFSYYIGTSSESSVIKANLTSVTSFNPTLNGYNSDKEKSRKDIINVRHWDFCDLFDWPQRLKWEQISNYKSDTTLQVFSVKMEAKIVPTVEIIGKFKSGIKTYMMRYVRVPKPIILEDIEDSTLSIDGIDKVTECELPSECHEDILERAVLLAKIAYAGTTISDTRNSKQLESQNK